MFCKYRDIFGKAGDYFGTILLAIIFSYFTKVPLVLATILMFVLGVILHWMFCVPTGAVKWLGLA